MLVCPCAGLSAGAGAGPCACALDFPSQQTFRMPSPPSASPPPHAHATRAPSTRPPPACHAPPPPSSSAARLAVGTPRRPLPPRRCRCGDRSMRCHLSAPPLSIAMASSAQAHAQAMVQPPLFADVRRCVCVCRRVAHEKSQLQRAERTCPSNLTKPALNAISQSKIAECGAVRRASQRAWWLLAGRDTWRRYAA